ncbi:MAG: glycosyltransferase family 2 protein [Desulfatibacillaceae bacterium]
MGKDVPMPSLTEDAPDFAFVIPVYNHAGTIAEVAARAAAFGRPVYVVLDGATDDSAEQAGTVPGVLLLRHERNLGKGAALLTGMREAAKTCSYAITLDADGQHDPLDTVNLLDEIRPGERPIVVGYRRGMDAPGVPWTSRWGRRFSNFWVWASSGMWLADTQTGFRACPLPETLRLGARSRRFQFEVEVLALARWRGIPIRQAEVTVDYAPKGRRISHFRPWADFWNNTKTFSRLIWRRIFVPPSTRARRGGGA